MSMSMSRCHDGPWKDAGLVPTRHGTLGAGGHRRVQVRTEYSTEQSSNQVVVASAFADGTLTFDFGG